MSIVKRIYDRLIVNEVQATKGGVHRQTWTNPANQSTTAIHGAISTVGTISTAITQPDFPRLLTLTLGGVTHTATNNITINGTDIRGNVISDVIALPGTASTVFSVKAFKTVTSIVTTTGVDASNTVAVGTANVLGLDRICIADECIMGSVDGTKEGTVPAIVFSTDIALNTVAFATALANTKVFRAVYVTNETTVDLNTTA